AGAAGRPSGTSRPPCPGGLLPEAALVGLPFEANPLPPSPWAHRVAVPYAPHEEMTAFQTIKRAGIRSSAQVPAPARTLARGSAPGPLSGPVPAGSARKATALAGLGPRPARLLAVRMSPPTCERRQRGSSTVEVPWPIKRVSGAGSGAGTR